jgi:hypothetical protein
MSSGNRLAVLVAMIGLDVISLGMAVAPARAQQVLACYSLHNDLANYDRRAHHLDHYFMPELKEARAAVVGDTYYLQCSFSAAPGEDCATTRERSAARYWRLQGIYDRSRLGGSDVIRLRIIDQMRYYGCPLPGEAVAYGEIYDNGYGAPRALARSRPAASAPLVYK